VGGTGGIGISDGEQQVIRLRRRTFFNDNEDLYDDNQPEEVLMRRDRYMRNRHHYKNRHIQPWRMSFKRHHQHHSRGREGKLYGRGFGGIADMSEPIAVIPDIKPIGDAAIDSDLEPLEAFHNFPHWKEALDEYPRFGVERLHLQNYPRFKHIEPIEQAFRSIPGIPRIPDLDGEGEDEGASRRGVLGHTMGGGDDEDDDLRTGPILSFQRITSPTSIPELTSIPDITPIPEITSIPTIPPAPNSPAAAGGAPQQTSSRGGTPLVRKAANGDQVVSVG